MKGIKFGKIAATKSLVTVETANTYGDGATREEALTSALLQAEESIAWARKNNERLSAEKDALLEKLLSIHQLSV